MRKIMLLLCLFVPSLSFAKDVPQTTFNSVIIYPAHGGEDPGAIGENGIKEKDETLKFAKILKNNIVESSNYNVSLVREKDENITPIRKLTHGKQDLLLIIHTGADKNQNKNGISITANPELSNIAEIKKSFASNGLAVDVIQDKNYPTNQITVDIGYITNKKDIAELQKNNHLISVASSIKTIIAPFVGK